MKNYYCPYCGEPSFKWYKKYLSSNAELDFLHDFLRCERCGKRSYLKHHIKIWRWLLVFLAIWLMAYFFKSFLFRYRIFSTVFLVFSFIMSILTCLERMFLNKIVRKKLRYPIGFIKQQYKWMKESNIQSYIFMVLRLLF